MVLINPITIVFLGHSAFLITSGTGTRIITDPYRADYSSSLTYEPITEAADIVTISHGHGDHDNDEIAGNPVFVRTAGEHRHKDVAITGIPSFHDAHRGKDRGSNLIFRIVVDGVSIVHLGDLGHVLNDETRALIGDVDILLVPVGGTYTIDAAQADTVIGSLVPRMVIPMHYRNDRCSFPIAEVTAFTEGKVNVSHVDSLTVTPDHRSDTLKIYVLKPTH